MKQENTAGLGTVAPKQTEVQHQMERMNSASESVQNAIQRLEERLHVVLRQEPYALSENPEEGCAAPHAETLRQLNAKIESSVSQLNSIINNIEL
jgi:hypothetical protein